VKTFTRLVLSALGVMTLTLAQTGLAMEKEVLNFWEVVDCPSEPIEMEGSVRFQFQNIGNADSWVFQAYWTGDAWGQSSGDRYRIQGKWMEVVKGNSPEPFLFIWNDHFELIGNGTAPNYRFYNKVWIHVDANGIPRIEFEDGEWPCDTIAYDDWP